MVGQSISRPLADAVAAAIAEVKKAADDAVEKAAAAVNAAAAAKTAADDASKAAADADEAAKVGVAAVETLAAELTQKEQSEVDNEKSGVHASGAIEQVLPCVSGGVGRRNSVPSASNSSAGQRHGANYSADQNATGHVPLIFAVPVVKKEQNDGNAHVRDVPHVDAADRGPSSSADAGPSGCRPGRRRKLEDLNPSTIPSLHKYDCEEAEIRNDLAKVVERLRIENEYPGFIMSPGKDGRKPQTCSQTEEFVSKLGNTQLSATYHKHTKPNGEPRKPNVQIIIRIDTIPKWKIDLNSAEASAYIDEACLRTVMANGQANEAASAARSERQARDSTGTELRTGESINTEIEAAAEGNSGEEHSQERNQPAPEYPREPAGISSTVSGNDLNEGGEEQDQPEESEGPESAAPVEDAADQGAGSSGDTGPSRPGSDQAHRSLALRDDYQPAPEYSLESGEIHPDDANAVSVSVSPTVSGNDWDEGGEEQDQPEESEGPESGEIVPSPSRSEISLEIAP